MLAERLGRTFFNLSNLLFPVEVKMKQELFSIRTRAQGQVKTATDKGLQMQVGLRSWRM